MKSYGLGWRLVFAAGLAPALAGFTMLGLALWSATVGSNDPWLSLVGQHSFSATGLEKESRDLHALWLLTVHLCGVNLAMSGVAISAMAWFALRDGQMWAWKFLWIMVLWVGVNDAVALLGYRYEVGSGLPYALIPLALGWVGLLVARRESAGLQSPDALKPPVFHDEVFEQPGDWAVLSDDDHFHQRYLPGERIYCETLMTTRGDPAYAVKLLRGCWDWWDNGHAVGFTVNRDGSTDQVLVPVSWFWNQVRMHILPPVPIPDKKGWRVPMNFTGSFEGSASFDVYLIEGTGKLAVRGRFHNVGEHMPAMPHELVTRQHLRAESGVLPFPFPHGTGWVGLRRRLEEAADAEARASEADYATSNKVLKP